MTNTKDHTESRNFDQVRHEVCAQLATMVRSGIDGFLLRFVNRDGNPVDCWIYSYEKHQWHKRNDFPVDSISVPSLFDDFENLSHRDVSDTWSCRRVDHGEHLDFELKFKPEGLEAHRTGDVESFLMGTLFGSHHDSGRDSRRRIRFRT